MARKRRMSTPYEDLYAQYGEDQYAKAKEFFQGRGIIGMGYSSIRREWSFMAVGAAEGPTTVIVWTDLEGFIEMLDAPHETLKRMHERGANVRP